VLHVFDAVNIDCARCPFVIGPGSASHPFLLASSQTKPPQAFQRFVNVSSKITLAWQPGRSCFMLCPRLPT
jgi:hypothetical protein